MAQNIRDLYLACGLNSLVVHPTVSHTAQSYFTKRMNNQTRGKERTKSA